MVTSKKVVQPTSVVIEVSKLLFDKRNPRFPSDVAGGSEALLLERFVRDERLLEIIDSIGDQGYFPGEPLLVVPKGNKYTVVEGNRRLAALKLLTGELAPPAGRISIESAVEHATVRPTKVPCLVFAKEDQILRYLGFRHITGIKAWSALQKARYMERLLSENYADVSQEDGLKLLARETGSKPGYLGQMLSALALYKHAEARNFYGLEIDSSDIDFSILSTSLSYSAIVDFLGLQGRNDLDLARLSQVNLKDMFLWLFVKKSNQKSVVGESRNLKKLAAVVASTAATKHLKMTGLLDESFEYSKGPSTALNESLIHAERRLKAAWDWLPRVTELNQDHLDRADGIARTAASVRAAIDVGVSQQQAASTGTKSGAKRSSNKVARNA